MAELTVSIGPMKIRNPVMPASGTFGYGQEYEPFLDPARLGAVVVKTITHKPRLGNPPHRSTEVPGGFLASIGLQNVGVDCFVEEKLPFFEDIDTRLIVSIGGDTLEEVAHVASVLERHDTVDALEVNASCPNINKGGMQFGKDLDCMKDLVTRVRGVTGKPLILKLTPMVGDIRPFAELCQKCGADAVSLINAPVGMAINIDTRRSMLGKNLTGGLTGPAIRPLALHLVWQATKCVDIPVIGIGGITCAKDALEFLIAGATAIQVGTMNFVNPGVTVEIAAGINSYLDKNGISSVNDLVGSLDCLAP